MTSVLTNVRSHFSQPGMSNDPRYQYAADLSRQMHPSTSTSSLTHIDPATSSSSSSTMSYPSSFALAPPTPATNLSSAPTSSDVASISQPSLITPSDSSSDPSAMYASAAIPSSRAFDPRLAAYPASSALVDLSASCPPEGPSFSTTGFDADLAAAALAPIFGTADSTLVDASATPFSFPALPASLLDEAPEYEYVSPCPSPPCTIAKLCICRHKSHLTDMSFPSALLSLSTRGSTSSRHLTMARSPPSHLLRMALLYSTPLQNTASGQMDLAVSTTGISPTRLRSHIQTTILPSSTATGSTHSQEPPLTWIYLRDPKTRSDPAKRFSSRLATPQHCHRQVQSAMVSPRVPKTCRAHQLPVSSTRCPRFSQLGQQPTRCISDRTIM